MAQLPASNNTKSNLRIKKFAVSADSILLDTSSVIPSSFSITNLDTSYYSLDFVKAILYWKTRPPFDSVVTVYRVFPGKINAAVQRISFDSIANNVSIAPYRFNDNKTTDKGPLNFGNIQYNGSFGRALSFGNKQDAVVNSNFQLQLNGMLKDSIEIAAALTDNNIPIQPDGTTQQLNEFDQVFLQFKKRNWQLNIGDIDVRQKEMYFLNFYKRLQGLSYQTVNRISDDVLSSTLVSGSIAKGKFTRNVFQGLEGNQGPYRLKGANNEFFFIVLANTERVYLDGELLQRGEDRDYIINYNTAEVTFMPNRMITKDSRIQIEFEYADRNYLNANLFLFQEVGVNNKLKVKVSAFSNSDSKNSQINQVLDNRQKQFLFNIGDSINKALYPTIAVDSFSSSKILYEKVYTNNGSILDSFYKYSIDPSAAKYNLSFTDMGQGNGNYVPDFNAANGKVYRYIEPVNGLKQGRFEPVMVLVTPKKHQLMSVGTEYQLNRNNLVKAEVAISNYDLNTFSTKNASAHEGIAVRLQVYNSIPLNAKNSLQLNNALDVEHVQQSFKPIERLRQVEFSREWGLPLVLNPATEDIVRLGSELKGRNNQFIRYQFLTYQRTDHYKGYQNILQHLTQFAGWTFNNQLAVTNFNSSTDKGSYFRPVLDMSKVLKQMASMKLGFRYVLENNEIRNKMNDSLSPLSFSFDTYSAYLKTDEAKKNKFGITFFTRSDKHPFANSLTSADRSYNVNVQGELLKSSKHQLLFNTNYRVLKVYNKAISPQKDDRTLLGRTEYIVNEWKGMVTGNVLYELGTGQEQKRDFAYLQVPAGQGEFTWIDYNSDGIQQINEFEQAIFRDQAKYIRIFTPTNQFTKANYTTFNYSFNLNPKALLNKSGLASFTKFISKVNFQSSLQKTKKSIAKGDFELNPFKYSIRDTALLTNTTSFINTFSFNRFSSDWGFDISNLRNSGKALLTYGYESRLLNDWIGKFRLNFSPALAFDLTGKRGTTALYTPNFSNRNYQILTYNSEPKLVYTIGTIFRVQSSYRWEQKLNAEEYGGEKSIANSINVESKYNVLQNSSINGRFTFTDIAFKRNELNKPNPNVEYIIMEALRPGSNFLWAIDFTKKLMNNVEMNLQYEGRRPADTKTIHTGRASIRALF